MGIEEVENEKDPLSWACSQHVASVLLEKSTDKPIFTHTTAISALVRGRENRLIGKTKRQETDSSLWCRLYMNEHRTYLFIQATVLKK